MPTVTHSDCGDWRLSDSEFLATFRLPGARRDVLRQRHPLPRESRIHFDEELLVHCVCVCALGCAQGVHAKLNAEGSKRVEFAQGRAAPPAAREEAHTYTIDGTKLAPRSVTGLVHKFTHEFDAQRVVAEMQVAASCSCQLHGSSSVGPLPRRNSMARLATPGSGSSRSI